MKFYIRLYVYTLVRPKYNSEFANLSYDENVWRRKCMTKMYDDEMYDDDENDDVLLPMSNIVGGTFMIMLQTILKAKNIRGRLLHLVAWT